MTWDDKRIEIYVANMLRTGVILAAAVVLAGGIFYAIHAGEPRPDYTHFHGVDEAYRSPGGILSQLRLLDARGLIQFGLLILIATPIARVVMCIVGFWFERDRMYMVISTVVFAILLYSLLHGR